MELFGMTIDFRRTNERDRGHQKLSVDPHKDLGVIYRGRMAKNGRAVRTDFIQNIIFPPTDGLDVWQMVQYDKQLKEFCEWLGGHKKFNICPVRELCDLTKRRFTAVTKDFYDKLHLLHCVPYENIPPEILAEIPMMVSAIFTEGKSLKDVSTEPAGEEKYMTRLGRSL